MEKANSYPKRKPNRLKFYNYSTPGAYFITICTKDKKCLFWDCNQFNFVGEDIILPPKSVKLSKYGEIVRNAISAITEHYQHIQVVQYVIMPNHIHMILLISSLDNGRMVSSPTSISIAVGQMKRYVSTKINFPIWQRSFHDHVIRDRNDYEKISKYIYENPSKWLDDCFYVDQ